MKILIKFVVDYLYFKCWTLIVKAIIDKINLSLLTANFLLILLKNLPIFVIVIIFTTPTKFSLSFTPTLQFIIPIHYFQLNLQYIQAEKDLYLAIIFILNFKIRLI